LAYVAAEMTGPITIIMVIKGIPDLPVGHGVIVGNGKPEG
jgi:hypothetical protein